MWHISIALSACLTLAYEGKCYITPFGGSKLFQVDRIRDDAILTARRDGFQRPRGLGNRWTGPEFSKGGHSVTLREE